ncbi:craniofacial development protein 2-like [Amphiura filiformis]|uniref:craniofacial development protein 2-like n=1 Tax=Amphiura filiformis TaxID=82378 RepID=UPI003B2243B7
MGAAVGGVGVLLSNFTRKVLVFVCYISPRIRKVTLNGNPQTTIIVTYSPTNVADEDDVTDFYNQLTKATREVPAHNFLIVIGDFSARVGQDIAKFSYHETTNRNGELMLCYTLENNLVVTNTTFQKRATKLWTSELPSGYRAQLDYVLVRKK